MSKDISAHNELFSMIKQLIDCSRKRVATTVNMEMSLLYWDVGCHIANHILDHKKPEYGKRVIAILSESLTEEYGKGWSEKQLRHCLYTVEIFPKREIFSTVCAKLSWSHIKEIIYIRDKLKREFYRL